MTSVKRSILFAISALMLLAIAGGTTSCKKKEESSSTLIVKVLYDGDPLANVHVFTVPFTTDAITDMYGLTKITGVPAGEYQVYAESGSVTGKSIIMVGQNEVQNATVDINYTGPITFIPQISFLLPDLSCSYAPGDTVTFRVKVTNFKEGSPVTWNSDLDGHLASTPVTEEGFSDFTTHTLSRGEHVITVKAEGREGYNAVKVNHVSMDGPRKVYLYPPGITGNTVTLRWSKYADNDFSFYQANCRYNTGPGVPFTGTISTGSITVVSDTSVTFQLPYSFCTVQFYIMAGNGSGKYNISNTREFSHNTGMVFEGTPVQMMQHPLNNWIYLVFADHTVLYDYQTKTTVASCNVGSSSRFTDLGDNGAGIELYLPGQSTLKVLDGNTLTLKKEITFPHELISVVSSGLGFLICSQRSESADVKPLQVYSLSQQALIAEGGEPFDTYYMKKIPGRNALAACTRRGYSSELDYFEYDDLGSVTLHNNIYNAGGGFSAEVMEMSPTGEYFCVGINGYFRTTDHDLTSVAYLNGSDQVSDFAFNDAGTRAYSCSSNSSLIHEYLYPSGSVEGEHLVYGSPLHMVCRGSTCIVASRTANGSQCCIVTVQL